MRKNRKVIFAIIFILFNAIGVLHCEEQNVIIKDVRGEVFDDSAQVVIESNCDMEYVDYTLQDPPRIVIDPMAKSIPT